MAQEKTYLSLSDIFFAILNFCYEYGQSVPAILRKSKTKVHQSG
jgi:hypothetical protein